MVSKSVSRIGRRRGASRSVDGRQWTLIVILVSVGSVLVCLVTIVEWVMMLQDRPSTGTGGTMPKPHQTSHSMPSISATKIRNFPPKFPKVTRGRDLDLVVQQSALERLQLDPEAIEMCSRTLWHTLETTTIVLPDEQTFIHTGDIDDLWLRDSAAQVHPLMVPFFQDGITPSSLVQQDPKLARIVSGLIKRTATYIRHDPYANAFRIDDSYVFSEAQKKLGRHDLISTWNYELDSACYFMRMIYFFYKAIPDHPVLKIKAVQEAIDIMLTVWTAEQNHEGDAIAQGPLLDCVNCGKPYRYPGLARGGKGEPVARTGMTWTGFRPSDDECKYGYLIPANMFAVVTLQYMAEIATNLWNAPHIASRASSLAKEINDGILQHGIVDHPSHGRIYAYEVDGLGHSLLMDDANVPSLMSIPYLDYDYDPEIYANTRRFILSADNPTYFKGTNSMTGPIEGYGSPHMTARIRANIWPMAMAMQALTSDDVEEKTRLANQLVRATGGTGWMHESFDVKNPRLFTRAWFCWADGTCVAVR